VIRIVRGVDHRALDDRSIRETVQAFIFVVGIGGRESVQFVVGRIEVGVLHAKGIDPDIQILEDVPDDLKGKDDTKGEASLKGHLKNGDDEKTGSQAYVPPDPKNDKQLIAAVDLLHGVKHAAASPAAADAVKDTPTPAGTPAPDTPAAGAIKPN